MSTENLKTVAAEIRTFIQQTFKTQHATKAVIAVSGGIDSAVSLSMLTKALGAAAVTPLLLPYGNQDMTDADTVCRFNQVAQTNWRVINIKPIVDNLCQTRNIAASDHIRRGNIMARVRMILVFDIAREQKALVCGTENKSEHYLGYFTRFGDAASDIEPIAHLYKMQVRELAEYLALPKRILNKKPSAGLWDNQTDEQELGFSYADADRVLTQLIDNHIPESDIQLSGISSETVKAVCDRVRVQAFKLAVPYTMEKDNAPCTTYF